MKKSLLIFISLLAFVQISLAQSYNPFSISNIGRLIVATNSITFSHQLYAFQKTGINSYITSTPVCGPLAPVLSSNRNYVATFTPRVAIPNMLNAYPVLLATKDFCDVQLTVNYLDGLGRSIQTISVKGSANAKDLVSPFSYDTYGRQTREYLPYVSSSNDGSFQPMAIGDLGLFYAAPTSGIAPNSYPFADKLLEASPLSRQLEQGSQGAPWQLSTSGVGSSGHTVKIEYLINRNVDGPVVVQYRADAVTISGHTHERTLSNAGNYAEGELSVQVVKDENWSTGKSGTIWEYKDKSGRVVLKRVWENEITCLSTYYVYDLQGHLSFVLPPSALPDAGSVDAAALQEYCYQYCYDGKGRVIEKKVPGKGWEWMVYGKRDELAMSQDAVQRSANRWLFSKYDDKGRSVMTGELTSANDRTAMQTAINSYAGAAWERYTGAGSYGYDNASYPTSYGTVFTVSYYDQYDFVGNSFGSPVSGQRSDALGFPTGSLVNVLGTGTMLLNVSYYDDKGRMVRQKSQNHLGGSDVTDIAYDFIGQVVSSMRAHTANSLTTTIANSYTYDHMGRKISTTENINSQGEVTLNRLVYNEIGQLVKKSLHGSDTTFLQHSYLSYNERGWMRTSTSAQFRMQLDYQDGTYPQYNGNISNQRWGSSLGNVFTYQYDRLNRLYNATSTGVAMSEALTYDVMGNITSLNRDGNQGTYGYAGNQLQQLAGSPSLWGGLGGAYAYDANGNATTDGRNGVTLTYNHLNLPITASKSGLSLSYTYDATGQKLRRVNSTTSTTTDYVDGIQYQGGSIEFIQTEEGIARNNGGTYVYEYNLTDHLGNVRYTFNKHPITGAVQPLQQDDYYAFGKRFGSAGTNKYLYNGKELQDELGQYDYGARFYDPVIARWIRVDNKAEAYEAVSPYVYAVNDPVNAIDPDGNLVIFVNGFVPDQWLNQNNRRYSSNGTPNPSYKPYPPSRALTNNYPKNLGKSFDYWGNIDNAFMQGYKDNHAMYINGSSDNTSDAIDRFSEGIASAKNLISQLDKGEISLADGETIKIVGHSQGGAFAAGMASVLSKNKKYASVIQEVVYLEPHQPADFNHPSSVDGIQISTPDDLVASVNIFPLFKGITKFSRINGISRFILNDTHKGDSLGGHSVGTNLDEIATYFRSLGVKVTIK